MRKYALKKKIYRCTKCKLASRVYAHLGSLGARVLFIIPSPSTQDCDYTYERNTWIPFFVRAFNSYAAFNSMMDGCFVPITFCSSNMGSKTVENCRPFINMYLEKVSPKVVVICGSDVYKAFLKDGKMPQLLAGRAMKEKNVPWTYFFISDPRYWPIKEDLSSVINEIRSFGNFMYDHKILKEVKS
jgi:uracil-DNA glycosylase